MTQQKKLDEVLHAKLTLETAKMEWKELERFFASGSLISISPELDMVEVAVRVANDDKTAVAQWLTEGRVAKVSDEQALSWSESEIVLWTVVVKPWILVQVEKRPAH